MNYAAELAELTVKTQRLGQLHTLMTTKNGSDIPFTQETKKIIDSGIKKILHSNEPIETRIERCDDLLYAFTDCEIRDGRIVRKLPEKAANSNTGSKSRRLGKKAS